MPRANVYFLLKCHWQYVIQNLFGEIKSLSCLGATHVKERVDESGKVYKCTADDSAYATFELKNGAIVHFNSSWAVRVRRDDLLTIQVDGTKGSAVAGLRYDPFYSPYACSALIVLIVYSFQGLQSSA